MIIYLLENIDIFLLELCNEFSYIGYEYKIKVLIYF